MKLFKVVAGIVGVMVAIGIYSRNAGLFVGIDDGAPVQRIVVGAASGDATLDQAMGKEGGDTRRRTAPVAPTPEEDEDYDFFTTVKGALGI